MDINAEDLKRMLVDVIDEMLTPNPPEIAPRWVGGSVVLQPSNDTQPKEIPLEVFFKKVIGVRDALRVLEQKVNTHGQLSAEEKAQWQGYITRAYGSLTTFNVLFKEGKDRFVGGSGSGSGGKTTKKSGPSSLAEAQKSLGIGIHGR